MVFCVALHLLVTYLLAHRYSITHLRNAATEWYISYTKLDTLALLAPNVYSLYWSLPLVLYVDLTNI